MKNSTATKATPKPVQPDNIAGMMPEFGRIADLTRLFGLKRGTAYNLLADGKIRGALLRVRGKKSGVRLFCLQSVRDCIHGEMAQAAESASSGKAQPGPHRAASK